MKTKEKKETNPTLDEGLKNFKNGYIHDEDVFSKIKNDIKQIFPEMTPYVFLDTLKNKKNNKIKVLSVSVILPLYNKMLLTMSVHASTRNLDKDYKPTLESILISKITTIKDALKEINTLDKEQRQNSFTQFLVFILNSSIEHKCKYVHINSNIISTSQIYNALITQLSTSLDEFSKSSTDDIEKNLLINKPVEVK